MLLERDARLKEAERKLLETTEDKNILIRERDRLLKYKDALKNCFDEIVGLDNNAYSCIEMENKINNKYNYLLKKVSLPKCSCLPYPKPGDGMCKSYEIISEINEKI